MKKRKLVLWLIRLLLLAGVTLLLGKLLSGPHRLHWPRHEVKIQDTQTLVANIREMSSLVSACYYDEVVLTATKQRTMNAFGTSLPLPDDEICLISHGKAQAGIDLRKLSDDALTLHGDTVMVCLPEPEIFEVILNPSDYEIFVEEGKWSHEEVVALERRSREAILRDALAAGLPDRARESAARQIERMLHTLGLKEVIVVPHSLPLQGSGNE